MNLTTGPAAVQPSRPPRARPRIWSIGCPAAAATVAIALPWLVNGYVISLASTAIILALLGISVQLLATAGLVSFGQTAYFGVGAYTAALLARAGITSGPAQLLTASLAGLVTAALTSPLLLRTRDQRYLMATFAAGQLAVVAASKLPGLGGDEGLSVAAVALPGFGPLVGDGYRYLYALACLAVVTLTVGLGLRTHPGLLLRAIADHEPRTVALGHPVTAHLVAASAAAGAVAATSGALLTATACRIAPGDFGFDAAALSLLAVTIGAGRLGGTIAGAVLIVATRDLIGATTAGHGTALLGLLFLTVAFTRHTAPALIRRLADRRRP